MKTFLWTTLFWILAILGFWVSGFIQPGWMFSVLPGPVVDQCPVAMMPDCSEKVDSLEVVPSALQPETSSETDNYQLLEERVNTLEQQVYYLSSQLALRAQQPAQESQLVPQPQPVPAPEAPIAHPTPMVEVIELPVQ